MNFEQDEREEYENICERLGVDPEEREMVGDILKQKMIGLYTTPAPADD